MDKIIEVLPKNKEENKKYIEAKAVLDAVEGGIISESFLELIKKDLDNEEIVEDEETIKNSVLDKIKSFFKKETVNDVCFAKNEDGQAYPMELPNEEYINNKIKEYGVKSPLTLAVKLREIGLDCDTDLDKNLIVKSGDKKKIFKYENNSVKEIEQKKEKVKIDFNSYEEEDKYKSKDDSHINVIINKIKKRK